MIPYLGEILALVTALFWAFTSIFFTFAGQRVGSRTVNRVRLLIAVPLLSLAHLIAEGSPLPLHAGAERWGWLGISALIGLVIGDGLLFYAFTAIGARLSMLLMALTPVISTLLAWLFLGERLLPRELLAIAITVSGIAWVVLERRQPAGTPAPTPQPAPAPREPPVRTYLIGVLAGIGGAVGQATGLVFSKQGMVGGFSPISSSFMRVLVATLAIWILAVLQGQFRRSFTALKDRRALQFITGGACVGPVLGMTLSLAAVQLSQVGIASTLMALSPVLLLPLARWLFKEQITLRAILGTGIAMVGVALIFSPAASPATADFNGELAYTWVLRQTELGYRITGTEANLQTGDLILETLEAQGWETREQHFEYLGVPVRNLLAWKGEGPALLLGAHYDTRRSADEEDPSVPVLGANDGASGVAVLLELARVLDVERTGRRVYLAFFDAEDNGRLDGWEWIVGSSHMAEQWGKQGEPPLEAVIVVDLVGDADQQLYLEHNSDPELSAELWALAAELGYGDRFIPEYKWSMLDDHIPFVRQGIPAVLIIDFDYPYWHTTQDTPDKVAPESLEAVGHTLHVWLEGE